MKSPSTIRDEHGFTLIELLIVMIILGILMAVAIPAFLGQKDRALATEAKNNAALVQKTMETCAAETIAGIYNDPANVCNMARLQVLEPTLNDAELAGRVNVANVTASTYTVTSISREGSEGQSTFTLAKTANGVQRLCNPAGNRMCPGSGKW